MSCLHPIIVRGPEVGSFGLLGVCVVLMWLPGDPRRGLLVAPRHSGFDPSPSLVEMRRLFLPSLLDVSAVATHLEESRDDSDRRNSSRL